MKIRSNGIKLVYYNGIPIKKIYRGDTLVLGTETVDRVFIDVYATLEVRSTFFEDLTGDAVIYLDEQNLRMTNAYTVRYPVPESWVRGMFIQENGGLTFNGTANVEDESGNVISNYTVEADANGFLVLRFNPEALEGVHSLDIAIEYEGNWGPWPRMRYLYSNGGDMRSVDGTLSGTTAIFPLGDLDAADITGVYTSRFVDSHSLDLRDPCTYTIDDGNIIVDITRDMFTWDNVALRGDLFPFTSTSVDKPTVIVTTTEAPVTQAPTTSAPTTEAPTTEAPTTEAPTTTAEPTTEAPDNSILIPDTYITLFHNDISEDAGEGDPWEFDIQLDTNSSSLYIDDGTVVVDFSGTSDVADFAEEDMLVKEVWLYLVDPQSGEEVDGYEGVLVSNMAQSGMFELDFDETELPADIADYQLTLYMTVGYQRLNVDVRDNDTGNTYYPLMQWDPETGTATLDFTESWYAETNMPDGSSFVIILNSAGHSYDDATYADGVLTITGIELDAEMAEEFYVPFASISFDEITE